MVSSERLYLGLVALVGAERVLELIISQRHAQAAFRRGAVETGQAHYRVMTVLHTLFLVSCVVETLAFHRQFPGTLGFVALGGVVAAMALRYWAILSLGEYWNTRIIVVPNAAPVTRGPYRFLRHPNYLAVVTELLCLPLVHGAYVTAIVFTLLNALLLTVRIRAEESALGPQYANAFAHKRRFLPGARRG